MRTTEESSLYQNLDRMSSLELLTNINREDAKVIDVIRNLIPKLVSVVDVLVERISRGGRVFYVGAGTSGRLGVLDASEIPPTYGVSGMFIGIIAGGDWALRNSIEDAEDDFSQCWKDLKDFSPCERDVLIGIAASGTTPYVLGGVQDARKNKIFTVGITSNAQSPLSKEVDVAIEAVVGPEFVTGSTRMKAGTSQKLILNMISTSVMIRLGKVKGNKMIDMHPANKKLVERGTRMIASELGVSDEEAKRLLEQYGSVRKALESKA